MSWFCITEVLLVPLIWSMSWSKTFVHWRSGTFLVHFSNVFGIDFLLDQWSTTLHSKNVYVTIDFTPCRVPQKKFKDHPSITCGHWECQEIVGFPGWGTKNHLPLQPAKSQANWTSIGGKMEKPPKGPRLFASICHDFFKQTYTYWTTSISLFFMHVFFVFASAKSFPVDVRMQHLHLCREIIWMIWHMTHYNSLCTSI